MHLRMGSVHIYDTSNPLRNLPVLLLGKVLSILVHSICAVASFHPSTPPSVCLGPCLSHRLAYRSASACLVGLGPSVLVRPSSRSQMTDHAVVPGCAVYHRMHAVCRAPSVCRHVVVATRHVVVAIGPLHLRRQRPSPSLIAIWYSAFAATCSRPVTYSPLPLQSTYACVLFSFSDISFAMSLLSPKTAAWLPWLDYVPRLALTVSYVVRHTSPFGACFLARCLCSSESTP